MKVTLGFFEERFPNALIQVLGVWPSPGHIVLHCGDDRLLGWNSSRRAKWGKLNFCFSIL